MKVQTLTTLLTSISDRSGMSDDEKWAKCLELLGISSVENLSVGLVKKLQERDPDNSRHYRDAYWYLKDRQYPPAQQREIDAAQEKEQIKLARESGAPRWFPPDSPDGEWGRPVDVNDTVGREKARNPEFAEQVEKNLAQDPVVHRSRYTKGG